MARNKPSQRATEHWHHTTYALTPLSSYTAGDNDFGGTVYGTSIPPPLRSPPPPILQQINLARAGEHLVPPYFYQLPTPNTTSERNQLYLEIASKSASHSVFMSMGAMRCIVFLSRISSLTISALMRRVTM